MLLSFSFSCFPLSVSEGIKQLKLILQLKRDLWKTFSKHWNINKMLVPGETYWIRIYLSAYSVIFSSFNVFSGTYSSVPPSQFFIYVHRQWTSCSVCLIRYCVRQENTVISFLHSFWLILYSPQTIVLFSFL